MLSSLKSPSFSKCFLLSKALMDFVFNLLCFWPTVTTPVSLICWLCALWHFARELARWNLCAHRSAVEFVVVTFPFVDEQQFESNIHAHILIDPAQRWANGLASPHYYFLGTLSSLSHTPNVVLHLFEFRFFSSQSSLKMMAPRSLSATSLLTSAGRKAPPQSRLPLPGG